MKSFPEISYVREHIGIISNKNFEFDEAITLREGSTMAQLGRLLIFLMLNFLFSMNKKVVKYK